MTTIAMTADHTLAELLDAYIRDYLPLKAPNTQYQNRLMYRWFTKELGHIPLAQLTPLVLRSWFETLKPHYRPNSIRRYRNALSAALTAAVENYAWIERHPLRNLPKPPAAPDRERCLSPEERQRLLAACQASRNRHLYVAVQLALCTGARKNELMQRRWGDIDFQRGFLSIPQSENRERRAVPLVPHALALLRQHQVVSGVSPWVFPRRDGVRPALLDYAWSKACERAGLHDLHFHDLRHCTASYLAISGAGLREIAAVLGHKSINQTMKYAHLTMPHTSGILQHMAEQYLDAPVAEPAAPTEQPASHEAYGDVLHTAEVIIAAAQEVPPSGPQLSMEMQVLDAVRAMEPLPASAIQLAGMLHLPIKRVRDILQTWAHRGTLKRISKGYYRYQPTTI